MQRYMFHQGWIYSWELMIYVMWRLLRLWLWLCPIIWHFGHQSNWGAAFSRMKFGTIWPNLYVLRNFVWICNPNPTFWLFYQKSSSSRNLLVLINSIWGRDLSGLLQLCVYRCWVRVEIHWILPDSYLPVISAGNDFGGICGEEDVVDLSFVAYEFKGADLGFEVPDLDQTISSSWNHLLPESL